MLKNFCLNCALLIFATQTNTITLICDYRDKNTGISFDRKISIDLDKKQISLFKNVLQYNVWDDRILIVNWKKLVYAQCVLITAGTLIVIPQTD